jgi:hypothetical protein
MRQLEAFRLPELKDLIKALRQIIPSVHLRTLSGKRTLRNRQISSGIGERGDLAGLPAFTQCHRRPQAGPCRGHQPRAAAG